LYINNIFIFESQYLIYAMLHRQFGEATPVAQWLH